MAKAKYADYGWENLLYGLREATPRILVTTTPQVKRIIKQLMGDPFTVIARGSTYDNRDNLSQGFFDRIIAPRVGTRLGRQEIFGEYLEDIPGALWTWSMIEAARVSAPGKLPIMKRSVVAIDPPATAGGDACGICVAGIDGDPKSLDSNAYVLDDRSEAGLSPQQWAEKAVKAFDEYSADRVIIETNQGGDMAEQTLRRVRSTLPITRVHATKSKKLRAEPVSALYEQGRVKHLIPFPELEEEMTSYSGSIADKSPDRLDAMVYAVTDLFKLGVQSSRRKIRSGAGVRNVN